MSFFWIIFQLMLLGLFCIMNRRRQVFELTVILFAIVSLIAIAFPTANLLTPVYSWRNLEVFDGPVLVVTQQNYFLLLLGVFVASILIPSWSVIYKDAPPKPQGFSLSIGRDTFMVCGLIGPGILLYLQFILTVGFSTLFNTDNFAEKYNTGGNVGPLYFGFTLVLVGALWAEAGQVSRLVLWAARSVLAMLLIWAVFFIYIRWPVIMTLIGYGTIWTRARDFKISNVRILPILLLMLVIFVFEGYSIYRSVVESGGALASFISQFSITELIGFMIGGSELIHSFTTAGEVIAEHQTKASSFAAFFQNLEVLIPRALNSNRGYSEAEDFALRNYGALFDRGGGTGYSLVASGVSYFPPYIGMFLFGIVFGAILSQADSVSRAYPNGFFAMSTPSLGYFVLTAERTGLIAFLKSQVLLFVFLLSLYLIFVFLAQNPSKMRWR